MYNAIMDTDYFPFDMYKSVYLFLFQFPNL